MHQAIAEHLEPGQVVYLVLLATLVPAASLAILEYLVTADIQVYQAFQAILEHQATAVTLVCPAFLAIVDILAEVAIQVTAGFPVTLGYLVIAAIQASLVSLDNRAMLPHQDIAVSLVTLATVVFLVSPVTQAT